MDFIIDQLLTWWQFVVVAVIILIGWVLDKTADTDKPRVNFQRDLMPSMRPLSIPTKGKGFWSAVWLWLMGVRQWELTEDFHYSLNDEAYIIPKGFTFDGASVPKFLATWLSPTGVLLMGGLVHDYGYKYATLMKRDGTNIGTKDQKYMDQLFRDICIEVNGFYLLNQLAYWALRLGGFVAWNGHRKVNAQI